MVSEEALIPYHPSDLRGERVLVFAPHPDDETFGCGGSIVLHRRHGDPVRVVFVTSGERGDWQGGSDPEALRMLREAEAGRALSFLGVEEWEFWRIPDRGVEADGALAARIADAVRAFQPSLIYAPAPLEVHPDHRALAHALRAALRGWADELRVGFYEVGYTAPVNTLVDVSAVWDVKEKAVRAYASQLGGPNYLAVTEGLSKFRTLTLGREVQAAEGFRVIAVEAIDSDPLWRWETLQNSRAVASAVPAVSVVVRTKDRPQFLREALASLASQSFADFEVVVVNDGGADVGGILAEYPMLRTTLVSLESNRGRGAASNAGVEAARGEFVSYLDDDDIYYPQHLEILHAFLKRHDHFGAVYSDTNVARYRLGQNGTRYELVSRSVEYSEDFDRDLLLYQNYISNLSLMHRRDAWRRVGGFDAELELLEDWDFVVRLAQEFPFYHLARCTSEYRIRDDGTNVSTQKPWGQVDEVNIRTKIFRRYWDKHTPENEVRVYSRLLSEVWNLRRQVSATAVDAAASPDDTAPRLAELESRIAELETDKAELEKQAGKLEERCSLLENESESLSAEVLHGGQTIGTQASRIAALGTEVERKRREIELLHQETARRQQLIDTIHGTRAWRWRAALRKLMGRAE
ncbi:MAG: PIG-L family deacetylase [Candidatus Binatia bacterium]